MSTDYIKQNWLSLVQGLLKGPFALPVLLGLMIWGWSTLDTEQIERIKELLPLFNSTPGITIAALIVLTYLGNMFIAPVKEMITALNGIKEQLKNWFELINQQHREMQQDICHIKQFYDKS